MSKKKFAYIILFVLVSLFSSPAHAKMQTFIKDYTYLASDADSKLSCRTIALEQVKKLLLEEIGSYIISETQVINSQLTRDQITALTAGVVKTEIISESWNGRRYYLKAKIVADPAEVSKSVQKLSNNKQMSKELEDAQKRVNDGLKEIERLKKELATAKDSKQNQIEYTKTINTLSANDWQQKGYELEKDKNYKEAIAAYSQAIVLNPSNESNYQHRASLSFTIDNYPQAVDDYTKVIEFEHGANGSSYSSRAGAYLQLGYYEKAVNDYYRAISLSRYPSYSDYDSRALCYWLMGNYSLAIRDYSAAIKIMEKEIKEAEDLERNHIVNPLDDILAPFIGTKEERLADEKETLALSYFYRGVMYAQLKDQQSALDDYKHAARLGDEKAQKLLRQNGYSW
jgi:tetratricopeptide (TPR) repeat protein